MKNNWNLNGTTLGGMTADEWERSFSSHQLAKENEIKKLERKQALKNALGYACTAVMVVLTIIGILFI